MESQSKPDPKRRLVKALAGGSVATLLTLTFATGASAGAAAPSSAAITATVRAELLSEAQREAAKPPYSYRHPSAIQVVVTTESKAWELENQSRNVDVPCDQCGTGSVYFIAMRGSSDCKTKPGELRTCSTKAPIFMLWVSPSTLKVSRTARGSVYPNLVTVGTPVLLG